MTTAVLCMAYGSPRSLDEVEGYLTDIRGGRPPSREGLDELKQRYGRIGGGSPLTEITESQASALQERLDEISPGHFRTYVGMKHWHPFIGETVAKIAADGVQRLIGLVLAPHYSKMSIGGYKSRVQDAMEAAGAGFELSMIPRWYGEPKFVDFYASLIREPLAHWDKEGTRVFFTAHSLPERILSYGDRYQDELMESSSMIAGAANVSDWEFAFQSASHTGEPWLGPDILERLEAFRQDGGNAALVAPVGFTADHLEILFDVDVECAEKCREVGLDFRRTASPNDQPAFIDALASVVLGAG